MIKDHFYKTIFDNAPLGIFLTTFSGELLELNENAARICGYDSIDDILGLVKDVGSDIYTNKSDRELIIAEIIEKNEVVSKVLKLRKKNGVLFDARLTLRQMSDTNKNQQILIGTIEDITEQVQAKNILIESQQELKKSNQMFELVLETIPIRVFWKDKNLNYLGCNSLFAKDGGLNSSKEIIAKNDYQLAWKSVAELYQNDDFQVIKSGHGKVGYEEPQEDESGNKTWLKTTKVPLRDINNNIIGVLGTYHDITERKLAEEKMRQNEELFSGIFDFAPNPIVVNDTEGNFLIVNKAFEVFSGYTAGEVIGKKNTNLSNYIDAQTQHKIDSEVLEKGFFDNIEVSSNDKSGRKRYAYYSRKLVYLNNKPSVLTSIIDITDKKIAQLELEEYKNKLELLVQERTDELLAALEELQASNEELQTTNEELHDKNEEIRKNNLALNKTLQDLKDTQLQLIQSEKMASLGTLTAGVAHEINNPLNYIMGAQVGLENYLDEHGSADKKKTDLLKSSILIGIERISDIVKGLNQFSRNNENQDEDCYLHTILDNCLVMLQNKIKHKAVIRKEYAIEQIQIKGNVGKLHQVFINILANSLQAIPGQGEISIKTQLLKEQVFVEITDTGEGIHPENLGKITDPFFTTKPPGEGTGLGLSITYSIIKDHKGEIEFESEPGKGTTVKITFPI